MLYKIILFDAALLVQKTGCGWVTLKEVLWPTKTSNIHDTKNEVPR